VVFVGSREFAGSLMIDLGEPPQMSAIPVEVTAENGNAIYLVEP